MNTTRVASTSGIGRRDEEYSPPTSPQRPSIGRSSTFQGPTTHYRESPPPGRLNSIPPSDIGSLRAGLRPTAPTNFISAEMFNDPSDNSNRNSDSPDRSYGARSVSPATSHGSMGSRSADISAANLRRAPPPPPSRIRKPAPPPPMKRADISPVSVNSRY